MSNDPSKQSVDLNLLKNAYVSSIEGTIIIPKSRSLKEMIHGWVDQRVDQKLQEYFKQDFWRV